MIALPPTVRSVPSNAEYASPVLAPAAVSHVLPYLPAPIRTPRRISLPSLSPPIALGAQAGSTTASARLALVGHRTDSLARAQLLATSQHRARTVIRPTRTHASVRAQGEPERGARMPLDTSRVRWCLRGGIATAVLIAGATSAAAQRVVGKPPPVATVDASHVTEPAHDARDTVASASRPPLFTRGDALLGAAFVVGAAAVAPFDRRLALEWQDPKLQSNRAISRASTGFRLLGDPGAIIVGSSLYAVGRLTHRERTADVGLHVTEAVIVSGVATSLVKGIAGRARPYVVGDERPGDFRFGRGFVRGSAYAAFPSGHTTVAFAAAAAATDEIGRLWPGRQRYAGPVLYGSAAAVGLSRMYDDKHWASDVVAGAAVGTLLGRAVVRYQHSHPTNRLDRWLLHASVAPRPDGLALAWSWR